MDLLARPLKFRNLHLGESVDIRAVEYLLNSSPSGLDTLTLTINAPGVEQADYFERLEPWLSRLSHLSTLTYVILCGSWEYGDGHQITLQNTSNGEQNLLQGLHHVTTTLDHVSRRRVREAQVLFETDDIDGIARCIFWNGAPLEACKELEQVLLTFPRCCVLFRATKTEHRGRRAEFWHRIVGCAFPRMKERGLLVFPRAVEPDIVIDPLAHESLVNCLVASHDSQRIVSASSDGTIIIWDAERGTIVHEWLAHRYPILALALSPDSRRLVSAGGDGPGALAVWDVGDTVSKVASLEGHTEALNACVWSPDGTLIASSDRGAVRVWDALTFEQRDLVLRLNEWEPVFVPGTLRFSPDRRHLAWISKSLLGTYRYDNCSIWMPLSGEQPRRLEVRPPRISHRENGYIHALSFHPGSGRVATAYGFVHWRAEGSAVRVWDVATGALLIAMHMAGHRSGVTDVSFSPDGRSVLSASADGVAKIWDAESGEETASFSSESGGRGKVTKACFSPDGKLVATTSFPGDSTVQLWRVEDRANMMAFLGHGWSVEHVVFSPNGEFLALGDSQRMVHIRRVPSFARH
ncbi:hypothetical protein GSI_14502 [Ganoderma sinense ZZ0214-1]|uniref:Uncharacterized protein n=1 Tax=Ganoderma sinense ZZ0214-1 TaxID=1077348 RepID=A0A2G8RNX2_9APHY|nr:hypothetical protein GSI_14502 [Ganoderma sinense ZZ0214-1]